jgi:hypothetical protein
MNNAEEIQERFPKLPPTSNRCCQCNGPFGLVRSRFALKNFCSNQCLNEYKTDTERKISRIKEWRDYYARKL